jgi:hypothetical protein
MPSCPTHRLQCVFVRGVIYRIEKRPDGSVVLAVASPRDPFAKVAKVAAALLRPAS